MNHTAVHLALRNRLLTVTGLPTASNRAFENKTFTPTTGTPYLEEDFVPSSSALLVFPPQGGVVESRGFYVVRWYGLAGAGMTAINTGVDLILAKFTPGTRLTASDSSVVRIAGFPNGPRRGQILPTGDGFAVCAISVPWIVFTTNAIAA